MATVNITDCIWCENSHFNLAVFGGKVDMQYVRCPATGRRIGLPEKTDLAHSSE